MATRHDPNLYPVKREPRNIWERSGLTERQRRVLDISLIVLLVVFALGWVYSAAMAIERGESPVIARQLAATGSPFASTSPPDANFTLNAVMERFIDWEEVRGASGALQLVIQEPVTRWPFPTRCPPVRGSLLPHRRAPPSIRRSRKARRRTGRGSGTCSSGPMVRFAPCRS